MEKQEHDTDASRNMQLVALLGTASPYLSTPTGLPDVELQYDVRRNLWVTQNDVAVWVNLTGELFQIAAGFEFDLSSIPRLVWWAIAPFELGIVSPLVHDMLYSTQPPGMERRTADRIMRELMRREGVPGWRRTVAYTALRLFGYRWGRRS